MCLFYFVYVINFKPTELSRCATALYPHEWTGHNKKKQTSNKFDSTWKTQMGWFLCDFSAPKSYLLSHLWNMTIVTHSITATHRQQQREKKMLPNHEICICIEPPSIRHTPTFLCVCVCHSMCRHDTIQFIFKSIYSLKYSFGAIERLFLYNTSFD